MELRINRVRINRARPVVVTNTNNTCVGVDSLSTTNVFCCQRDDDILSAVLLLQLLTHKNITTCLRLSSLTKNDENKTSKERCFKTVNL